MTEGEVQLNNIPNQIGKIRNFGIPLAIILAVGMYVQFSSIIFSLVAFVLLLLVAADEYWARRKILQSEVLIAELKIIGKKRDAAVFINGGSLKGTQAFARDCRSGG